MNESKLADARRPRELLATTLRKRLPAASALVFRKRLGAFGAVRRRTTSAESLTSGTTSADERRVLHRTTSARSTYVQDPRILILDEASSSTDTETEAQIQEALARLIQGPMSRAVAHRLSTLKHANRVIILAKGELQEIGSREELAAKDGISTKLCKMQTEFSKIRAS